MIENGVVALRMVMRRELDLLCNLSRCFSDLASAVKMRQWEDFQTYLQKCESLAQDFARVDQERKLVSDDVYKEVGLPSGRSFLELLQCVSQGFRDELRELYVSLRVEFHSFRCRLGGLTSHIQVYEELMRGVVEAISGPVGRQSSRDMIYSSAVRRAGKKAMDDPRTLLVNAIR